jgi:RNA polymerase sigma factor (sigma-70 family)
MTADTSQIHDHLTVAELVTSARNGEERAWDELVQRYTPLVWSICRCYRLGRADAADVAQTVWLRLVDQLTAIRDPAALAGWLATTTRRECIRVVRSARRLRALGQVLDDEHVAGEQSGNVEHDLLEAERHAALREAFTRLPLCCQRLLALLIEDPPVPYAEISARLGIPVGSIGPSRGRCLDKLRRDPAVAALINA